MAIGFRAFSSGDIASAAATATPGKPSGFASTDVFALIIGTDFGSGRTTNVITPASGWSPVNTALVVTDSHSNHIALNTYLALGSVASTTYGNSQTGANYQQGWVILAFTGVDNTTPLDVAGTNVSSTAATNCVVGAMTPVTTGAIKVIPSISWIGGVWSASGMTAKQNAGANADASCLYDLTALTAGVSTGTTTITTSGGATNQIIAAMPFLLRPDTGGAVAAIPNNLIRVNQSIVRASYW